MTSARFVETMPSSTPDDPHRYSLDQLPSRLAGRATTEVRRLIDERLSELSMCAPVAMEIIAGASTDYRLSQLTQLVNELPSLPVEPSLDFRSAAEIFRRTRGVGSTGARSTTSSVAKERYPGHRLGSDP